MFVAHIRYDSFPQRIVDTRATKHIVHHQAGFIYFYRYPVSSHSITARNYNKEDVIDKGTDQLRLHRKNTLLLHEALYALRC